MADLLYGCVAVDGRKERKQRQFRHKGFFTIDGFTNEQLRARYRFGRESIRYITDLFAEDLRRETLRNHPLSVLFLRCFEGFSTCHVPPAVTRTAFTASVISSQILFFLAFVTLVVNLLCRMSMFSSNFSVKTEIFDGEKFDLRTFFARVAILNKRFPTIL